MNVLQRDGNTATSNTGGGLIRVRDFSPVALPLNSIIDKVEIRFHLAGVKTTYKFQSGSVDCQDHLNPGYYKSLTPTSVSTIHDYIVDYTKEDCKISADNIKSGNYFVSMYRVLGIPSYTIDDISVRFTYTYELQSPTPTTTGPEPFLDLPLDYTSYNKTFEQVAFNPSSWFDHEYPLQNVNCCLFTALNYAGNPSNFYKSHNGYDYASSAGIKLEEPVLAAANGFASFIPEINSGGLGNTIKINHVNGYQTWYGHLSPDNLIVSDQNSEPVFVSKGQIIGYVGMSGNSTGPHIHFSVFKDANENDNFNDDYPFGLVDPLGWDGAGTDPWEEYEQNGRKGSKSYNLFTENIPPYPEIIPDSGGSISYKNINLEIPDDAYNGPLTIKMKIGPYVKIDNKKSPIPSILLEAFDSQNQPVTQFSSPLQLTLDYSDFDLANTDINSLLVYYFDKTSNEWVSLPTTVSVTLNSATASTDHFTQFALMGELLDHEAPVTDIILSGEQGLENWFRTDVTLELNSVDNASGTGVMETIYSTDGNNWLTYEEPLIFTNEGNYKISYMSYDKADNREKIKNFEFNIDKTAPQIEVATDKVTLWPPNGKMVPVIIDGSSSDENILTTIIEIEDEYNKIEPKVNGFGETVFLEAYRKALDRNGRKYAITAKATDKAGNLSTDKTEVIVPHDQGKLKEILSWLIFKLISSIK